MLPLARTSVLPPSTRRLALRFAQPGNARTVSSSPARLLAQPPTSSTNSSSDPEREHLNEAQRYLERKATRKADRARDPTSASARHASLYSQLFPALLRILAYGSSAYFGLHLLWNVLDRDEQTKLMHSQTTRLEDAARSIAHKVDKAQQQMTSTASAVASDTAEGKSNKRWYWPF